MTLKNTHLLLNNFSPNLKVNVRANSNDLKKHMSVARLPTISKISISSVFGGPLETIILWRYEAKIQGHSRLK